MINVIIKIYSCDCGAQEGLLCTCGVMFVAGVLPLLAFREARSMPQTVFIDECFTTLSAVTRNGV